MLREFKTFLMRGNVVDLAVAVVLGAAFGAIVTSFVNDLFVSLSGQWYPTLAAAKAAGAPTLNYGVFINAILNFVIVAFAVFLLVRQANRLKGPPPPTRECPQCATAIPVSARRCPHCTSELAPRA